MKLARDFGYITGHVAILGVFNLGLIAWIARVLGPEGVGIYAVTLSIVRIFYCLLVYGLQPAAAKFIPEHRVRGDTKKLVSLILNLYLLRFGLGFAAALILYLSRNFIASFYNFENLQEALGCGVFLLFLYGIYLLTGSCLQGFQKFRQLFFFQCIFVVSAVIGILIFFIREQSMLSPLRGIGLGWAISIVYGTAVIFFALPLKAWKDVDKEFLMQQGRGLMAYALPAGISFVFVLLIDNMGPLIVARFVSVATVGYFAFSYQLASYFSKANFVWETLYLPKFSEIFSQERKEYLVNLFSTLLKNLFLLNTVAAGLGLIFSPYLVKLLGGEKFASAIILFQVFVIINVIRGMNPAINSLYYTYHRTDYLLRVSISKCLMDMVLLLIIVPRFGVVPAASAVLISWLVVFYYNFHLVKKTLQRAFFKREAGFILLVSVTICLYLVSIFYKGSWNMALFLPIAAGAYLLFKGRNEFFNIFKA